MTAFAAHPDAPAGRSPYPRLLIVALGGIGDVLMAEPAVRLVRRLRAIERLDFLAHRSAEALLELRGPRERLFAWDDPRYRGAVGRTRLVRDLRRGRYDAALAMWPSSSLKCLLAPVLAGVPVRIIHRYECGRGRHIARLATRRVPYRPLSHRVERNLELVVAAGLAEPPLAPLRPRVALTTRERLAARDLLADLGRDPLRPLVAVHPGCTASAEAAPRRWPLDLFARLLRDLAGRTGAQGLIVAGPGERAEAAALAGMAGEPPLMLDRCAGLRDVAAVLAEADALVANDSGIGHLAAAVGTPVVSLFGPTDPAEVRPFGGGVVVRSDLPCAPCTVNLRHGPRRCEAPCMRAIRPEQVLAHIQELLWTSAQPAAAAALHQEVG